MPDQINWVVDQEKSTIVFKVGALIFGPVEGSFRVFGGKVLTNGNDFSSAEAELWIDTSSITTGDTERDAHLKSADFFDSDKFRQITFTSTSVQRSGSDIDHKLSGKLVMKGISNEVIVDVHHQETLKDASGNENAVFVIMGKINRKDWKLTWNATPESGGLMESEEVTISGKITLISQAGETRSAAQLKELAAEGSGKINSSVNT